MINLKNVSKSYGEEPLFSEVSFSVGEKEKVGLIGRNGYGKSTFFKLITGEESIDEGIVDKPEMYIIRKLEQNLNFEKDTLLDQVARSLSAHEKDDIWKAKTVLMGLGFTENDFVKAPSEFSSGFQIRIRLAESLVSECDLLLLDEPTNYLDIVSIRWLKKFLKSWKTSFILITHDISFMNDVTTHSAIIHRGKIRKLKGFVEKLINHIKKDEEIYEQTRLMDEKKQAKTDIFISKFRSGARSAGLVQSRIKMLAKKEKKEKLSKLPQINFYFPNIECSAEHLLRSYNITFGYNENSLIKKFSLDINNGDKIAIIGRNGKGKSTLLRLLASILKPNSGHLKSYHSLTTGYFGDNSHNYHASETILSELAKVGNNTETEIRKVAASLLFTKNEVKKNMQDLSGGEKSRVQLGKLMLKKHHLLFLDEPSNHLDIESVQELVTGLKNYEGSLVFVSHDERILSEIANKIVVFHNDSVQIVHGGYDYFLDKVGWGDEEIVEKVTKEKNINNYEDRKQKKKKLQFLKNEQSRKENEQTKCNALIEKFSLKLNKELKKNNSKEVIECGKKVKFYTDEKERLEMEIENLMEQEILLEDEL